MFTTTKYLYIRNDKIDKKGLAPIYLRLSSEGSKIEIYTKQKIEPDKWDQIKQKCKGSNNASINYNLEQILAKISSIENKYLLAEQEPSLVDVKNELIGKKEKHELISFWHKYLERIHSLIGEDYSEGTYKKYRTTKSHFTEFLNRKKGISEIEFSKVNHDLIQGFMDFMKIDKKLSHNTVVRYMKNFKVVIDEAKKRKWINEDPFGEINLKYREIERQYLTADELRSLESKDISIDRLGRVRDCFLFCCYTGLSFSDLKTLTKSDFIDHKGVLMIDKPRVKTNIESLIPIGENAKTLLNKYNFETIGSEKQIFPVLSNQKYNAYLKELAVICGIDKELCTHDARRTFATTYAMEKGVSLDSVSKMLGHSSIDSTRIYAVVTDEKIIQEMRNAGNL